MSEDPGRCPMCGMTLLAIAAPPTAYACPMHPQVTAQAVNKGHDAGQHAMEVDRPAENHGIRWQFTVGDREKIRPVNEMDSDHPMHLPFHIHGAGRFLVLARDGQVEPNLMWKDTVLVRTGETVDIVLDVTNPGRWMAHCHIAEHHESGMMFSFEVTA